MPPAPGVGFPAWSSIDGAKAITRRAVDPDASNCEHAVNASHEAGRVAERRRHWGAPAGPMLLPDLLKVSLAHER